MLEGSEPTAPAPAAAAATTADPTTAPTAVPAAPPAGKGRRLSARRLRLIVVVAVVAVIVTILLWGMVPEKILEVREVLGDAAAYDGTVVQVKGTVRDWNATTGNFTLVDPSKETKVILVHYGGAFPEGFGENITVVVKGTFAITVTSYEMEASQIQVGCPSKY